ncbi:MAG: hypothetical protein J5529_10430 [Prevotella sp.]|nr:hypothetical protein [Prevotella sp.]
MNGIGKTFILCIIAATMVASGALAQQKAQSQVLNQAQAQPQAKQILFRGIPLGGELTTFKQLMLERGFALNECHNDQEGTCSFTGKFAGDFVDVCCAFTPSEQKVAKVEVLFKRQTVDNQGKAGVTKQQQLAKFNELYKTISNNYGKPARDVRGAGKGVERLVGWTATGGSVCLLLQNLKGRYTAMSVVFYHNDAMQRMNEEKPKNDNLSQK